MSLLDLNHANLTQTLLSRLFQSDIRTWLLDYAQPYKELMAYYRCAMMEVSTKFQVSSHDGHYQKVDRTPAGLEPDPRPDGYLFCRAYA